MKFWISNIFIVVNLMSCSCRSTSQIKNSSKAKLLDLFRTSMPNTSPKINNVFRQCGPGQLQCYNSKCIPINWKCNGWNDCGDGSDEIGCSKYSTPKPPVYNLTTRNIFFTTAESNVSNHCNPEQFQCSNSWCIPIYWVCDGWNACPDGGDEIGCSKYSTPRPPVYNLTNKKNFFTTAEKNVSNHCNPGQFQCSNSWCIPMFWVCNGWNDCGDASDEIGCSKYSTPRPLVYNLTTENNYFTTAKDVPNHCNLGQFQCNNSWCIPIYWVCNGWNDCGDRSDETGCSKYSTPRPPVYKLTTWNNFFTTAKNNVPNHCNPGQFECSNSWCIPGYWVCNGWNDCGDGSDEIECSKYSTPRPPVNSQPNENNYFTITNRYDSGTSCMIGQFKCYNSGQCIRNQYVCDGRDNCVDKSDEIGCRGSSNCMPGQFKCYYSSRCIPTYWVCNSYNDCDDGSDEIGCNEETSRSPVKNPTTAHNFITSAFFQTRGTSSCGPGQFRCYDSSRCISTYWVCDGDRDCNDGSDEIGCWQTTRH